MSVLGEMLAAQDKRKSYTGFQQRNSVLPSGIDKKESHHAQQLHKHEETIAKVVAEAREKGEVPLRERVLKTARKIAFALRKEDAKKNTQKVVAAKLGVGIETVSRWLRKRKGSNSHVGNTSAAPDARVKVPPKQQPVIAELVESKKKSVEQAAADYGLTWRLPLSRTAHNIVPNTQEHAGRRLYAAPSDDLGCKRGLGTLLSTRSSLGAAHGAL